MAQYYEHDKGSEVTEGAGPEGDCIAKVHDMMCDLVSCLRSDVDKLNDPKARAMFEMAAEVVSGLATTFEHYHAGNEKTFQR